MENIFAWIRKCCAESRTTSNNNNNAPPSSSLYRQQWQQQNKHSSVFPCDLAIFTDFLCQSTWMHFTHWARAIFKFPNSNNKINENQSKPDKNNNNKQPKSQKRILPRFRNDWRLRKRKKNHEIVKNEKNENRELLRTMITKQSVQKKKHLWKNEVNQADIVHIQNTNGTKKYIYAIGCLVKWVPILWIFISISLCPHSTHFHFLKILATIFIFSFLSQVHSRHSTLHTRTYIETHMPYEHSHNQNSCSHVVYAICHAMPQRMHGDSNSSSCSTNNNHLTLRASIFTTIITENI